MGRSDRARTRDLLAIGRQAIDFDEKRAFRKSDPSAVPIRSPTRDSYRIVGYTEVTRNGIPRS
jgi:hypothetical protein